MLPRAKNPWTLLGPEDGAKLEAFIRCHEIYLNNLGSRLRDSLPKPELDLGAAFRGLRSPWTAAALENRAIFALQAQGFSALHATDPSLFRSEFAGLRKLLGAKILGIRTLMGETRSVDAFQSSLGRRPEICVRYVMMAKETPGLTKEVHHRFSGDALFRRSLPSDLAQLLPLQLAYEEEEVLLPGHKINLGLSRYHLSESLAKHLAVHGEYRGRVVAKAMTNARGFRYDQIGGVYTVPEYRGLGWGRAIMAQLLGEIEAENRAATLFVKPENHPALKLYEGLGFSSVGEFSIVYYA